MTQGGLCVKFYKLKCIVESEEYAEENYGVLLVKDDDSREYICNLSTNPFDVTRLVDELNCTDIEYCHVNSVIEDFKYNQINQ